jgi:hypothetical protein
LTKIGLRQCCSRQYQHQQREEEAATAPASNCCLSHNILPELTFASVLFLLGTAHAGRELAVDEKARQGPSVFLEGRENRKS